MTSHHVRILKRVSKVLHRIRLAANTRGREFVVGDLHGHRALLERALEAVGFDPAADRVFSVGDLIDRGPDSLATLSLIEQPWFHAVLGNHELMLLNYLRYHDSRAHSRKAFEAGGGAWIVAALERHRKTVFRLADAVAALPLEIEVDGVLPFRVMHSDLHPVAERGDTAASGRRVCIHLAEAATASRANLAGAGALDWFDLPFGERTVRLSSQPVGARPITYVGHCRMSKVTVHRSYVYIDQGVGSVTRKRPDAQMPTVIEQGRFGRWLGGVVLALSRSSPSDAELRVGVQGARDA